MLLSNFWKHVFLWKLKLLIKAFNDACLAVLSQLTEHNQFNANHNLLIDLCYWLNCLCCDSNLSIWSHLKIKMYIISQFVWGCQDELSQILLVFIFLQKWISTKTFMSDYVLNEWLSFDNDGRSQRNAFTSLGALRFGTQLLTWEAHAQSLLFQAHRGQILPLQPTKLWDITYLLFGSPSLL